MALERRRPGGRSASATPTRGCWCWARTSRRPRPVASESRTTRTGSSSPERMSASTFTRALVDSVRSLRYEEVSEEAREVGRQCLLDFLGCALAGAREQPVEILVATVVRPERSTEAALVGRTERASRLTAALATGPPGQALDFAEPH